MTPHFDSVASSSRPLGAARRHPRLARYLGVLRPGLLAALLVPALLLPGCGSKNTYPPYNGIVLVDNVTHTTTNEILFTFYLSPFGQPWTGDILGGDLFPNESRSLGVWNEDYYDAEGDMELGDVIQWFDIFVGEGATTVFEVL